MEFIEKEEAAGRLTVGMRKEKATVSFSCYSDVQISAQLKSISKKTPATDFAFQKRTPFALQCGFTHSINESRNGAPSMSRAVL